MRKFCDTTASCGTAYCFAGWLAVDPWFQKNTSILDIFDVHRPKDQKDWIVERISTCNTFTDLALLLDIGKKYADFLFGGNLDVEGDPHAVTKDMIIENLDRILNDDHPLSYNWMIKNKELANDQ